MTSWTVIVPVARWDLAKTRLHVRPDVRRSLARAFSLDVLGVVNETPDVGHVVLVTAERELHALSVHRGATVVRDPGLRSADSLNEAIGLGRAWALSHRSCDPIVVVPADLACLTSSTFAHALSAVGRFEQAFVPDESGNGTTLLAANSPTLLRPLYGKGSARRHTLGGGRSVIEVDMRVRRDVDTLGDLAAARELGVGPETERTLGATGVVRKQYWADRAV